MMRELALGEHIVLGDFLIDLHTAIVHAYIQQIKENYPLCADFVRSALCFEPENRKEAPRELISLLSISPPSQWLFFCQSMTTQTVDPNPDVTGPMDIVFQTEEIFEHSFPTSEEITHHELTEELFAAAQSENPVQKEKGKAPQEYRTIILLVGMILVLFLILVYMQRP